jgi:hypothetical protein
MGRATESIIRAAADFVPDAVMLNAALYLEHGKPIQLFMRRTRCGRTMPCLKRGQNRRRFGPRIVGEGTTSRFIWITPSSRALRCFRRWSTTLAGYDVYRGTADRTLRLATLPGAGLPAHLKRKDWMLMRAGKSPIHSDTSLDVALQGYCYFQVVAGE